MAWALYMELPTNTIVSENPSIQRLASSIERSPKAVKAKIWNLAGFDRNRLAEGKISLSHGGHWDRDIWLEYDSRGDALLEEALVLLANGIGNDAIEIPLRWNLAQPVPTGLTRETVVAQRVNQSYFRNRLMENYGERCCLTGLAVKGLLVASHIKPWAACDPATERLAPDNGLLLNSLHDRAFDQGLITLDRQLRVVVSPAVPRDDEAAGRMLWAFEGRQIAAPKAFAPRREFIEYHNDVVFRRSA